MNKPKKRAKNRNCDNEFFNSSLYDKDMNSNFKIFNTQSLNSTNQFNNKHQIHEVSANMQTFHFISTLISLSCELHFLFTAVYSYNSRR